VQGSTQTTAQSAPSTVSPAVSAVCMERISKRFGATQALREVSLVVQPGRIHALVGENGAGKSTLMKILAGAELPDRGRVLIEGLEVCLRRPADALAAGIAMVYQELSLAPNLSVAENVFLGHEPRLYGRFDRRRAEREVTRLAKECGMSLPTAAKVGGLPTALRQQVEILRALAHEARVIILDEPTSSLAEREVARLMETLRDLKTRTGIAVIYISHKLDEVESLADDLTILRDGRCVYSGTAGLSRREMIRHMVGREMTEVYPSRTAAPQPGTLLEVQGLSGKGFRNVSFRVAAGEVVGLGGLVGAGRSELADALAGVTPARTGCILVDGKTVRLRTPQQAIRHGIGYLTEDRRLSGLFPHLSVAANMTVADLSRFARLGFLRRNRITAEVVRMIELLGIKTPGPHAAVTGLSGGNQQKVLVARWLLTEARILILDEPTRGIDVGAKHDIFELVNHLAARGIAILMISSELPELLGVTDRILILCRGELTADLTTAAATPEKVMHFATLPATAVVERPPAPGVSP